MNTFDPTAFTSVKQFSDTLTDQEIAGLNQAIASGVDLSTIAGYAKIKWLTVNIGGIVKMHTNVTNAFTTLAAQRVAKPSGH